ncbi:Ig-like domain-containing protein, partial [Frateuria sp.]|uniref:Ig-like domain-containing protein n=1 Tax=Frateuria sp. TaxID=2211372 RepID=UPI003F7ED4A8
TDTSDATGNPVTVSNVPTPTITSATYNASTGSLVVTGSGFLSLSGATNDIVANKLTFTGEGGQTYTLTDTADVDITSAASFTLFLSATDKAGINLIVNKIGTSSTGGTTYNLAAAEDWAAGADAAVSVADTTGNGITVSNVAKPAITSATYDAATGTVVVTGTGFLSAGGANNDIIANKFTFAAQGQTYTLTDTANVDITSGTGFTLVLSATDKAAVDGIIDKNGATSTDGTIYNLAAAEDWAAGADAAVSVSDTTGNPFTASNVDASAVATTSGGTTVFVEGTPVAVDAGLTLSDVDNATLASATVTISGGFHAGQDVLSFTNVAATMGNITASYNAGTGVMTLASAGGTATLAQWQAALRSITYIDTAQDADAATRTVSFTVNDGTRDSAAASKAVSVTGVNDAPMLTTTVDASPQFTEGGAAVTLFSGTTIGTVEAGQNIHALTVTVGGLADGGSEILNVDGTAVALTDGNIVTTATNGYAVSVTLSGGTATVTITRVGDYSASAAQALVNGLSYRNNSDNPTVAGGRTITLAGIQDTGGTANGGVDTASPGIGGTVLIQAINDAPVATASGGSASFVAGDNVSGTPVVVDAGMTVTDADNTSLAAATIAITGGFHAGEDVLAFVNDGATMGNIAASYDASTGVLTLTSSGGTATLAQWQAALRSVTYTDTATTPDTATRTVSFALSDGIDSSATVTRAVTVTAVDQTPIVTTTGGTTNYVGGTSAVTIDGGITVSDLDNVTQSSATVMIGAGFASGDVLGFVNNGSSMGNIAGSYNAATGVLTLTSSGATATNAQWADALSSVTFSSTSTSYGNRTIDFATSDGSKTSVAAIDTVDVLGPPQITTDAGSTAFVAGDNTASTPVAIDAGLSVTDGVSTTLASATIAITGNFHSGEDVLLFTNNGSTMGNIVASYNAATGVLTMTSAGATATLAQWQSALESVRYTDTAVTPNTATRTVSFTAVDGGGITSNTATRTITVTAVDQTPIVTTTGGTTDYVYSAAPVTIDSGIAVSDLDNATQSSATVTIGAGFASGDMLGFVNNGSSMGNIAGSYNAASGVLTLTSSGATATNAQWANALSSVTFSSSSTSYGNRTIDFMASDGSKTSALATDTVNLIGIPKVTNVSSTAPDGSYKIGDTVYLTVTFDQAVVVDGTGGTPTLQMETGGIDHDAIYVSGSGSNTLTFAYTVQAGDASADLDYASSAALALAGGTIRSSAGVDAELTLPATGSASSIAGQHAIVVDGIAPTVVSVDAPANGTYVAGQNLDFTVNYSDAVTVDTSAGTPRIAITLDTGGTVYAHYVSGSGTTALVFRYTVQAGQNDADGITLASAVDDNGGTLRDAVGNAASDALNSVASTVAVHVDALPPTANISLSDTALAAGETSTVTITFSEAVNGLTTADFTVANGALSGLASSDGGVTWTATFTPGANISVAGNLIVLDNTGVQDAAGNAGLGTTASATYAIDTARPTASILVADTALKTGETSQVTITFSEAVSGLTTADFTVANGALSGLASSDGGLTWTATLTPTIDVANASNTIVLDATGLIDSAGNTGVGSVASNVYAIDTARPTASIVVADTALKAGETSQVTITFSEAVSGLTTADFKVANGSLSGLASSDGGVTWTATLTPTADGTDASNTLTLEPAGVSDVAGNAGIGSVASNVYAIDTARPAVSIVVADTALKAGETSQVTIAFSEAVSGLTTADLTVANGSLSGLASSDGGVTWTATLTPTIDTTNASNTITLDATGVIDLAGNTGAGSIVSNSYAIDTARPTASILVADTALKAGETSQVTITFSEAVSGLTTADFTVANGALSGLASSDGGLTWTATLTPTIDVANASNTIVLDATGLIDAAGNTGVGSVASNVYAIDTARPTASIVVADTALKAGETSQVTITFSEAVSGLTTADFTVANGSLSGLASSDGGVTWTATLTPTADVTDASNTITLATAGVTDAAGNAGALSVASNTYAVDTHAPQLVAIDRADASPNSGQQGLDYTVTFDEDVSGLDVVDFALVLSGNARATIGSVTRVDGHTYTVHLVDVGGSGSVQLGLAAGGSGIADLAGNTLAAGGQGEAYVVGGVAPVVLPTTAPSPAVPTAGYSPVVSSLAPITRSDLSTIYFAEAAPPRTFDLPFETGGVFDALAALVAGHETAQGDAAWADAWSSPPPIVAGSAFRVPLPAGDVLQASMADGRPLPPWLVFDPVAGTLSGTAPRDFIGTLSLLLTVRDGQGDIREVPVQLSAGKAAPAHAEGRPTVSRPALAAQFGQQRQGADHAALLRQLAVAQRHVHAPVRP